MSSVIPIFKRGHVEIHGGVVSSSTITDAHGTRPDRSNVGQYRFFVDLIERDGGRIGLWDGPAHADAIREAEAVSRDAAIPVRDLVVGGEA
ncbi:hypothetical protein [Mesorhizobium sp. A556]